MKTQVPIEVLLQWRLARAEAEAPRAPRGARLLELVRPWWETWPERFQSLVERVGRIQLAYGHAMTEAGRASAGHRVAALVVRGGAETETSVRMLFNFAAREGRLRLRFHLEALLGSPAESFEVSFVGQPGEAPWLSAPAVLSLECEYRIDVEISPALAAKWESLRVTDPMPFRLILRAPEAA